MTLRIPLALLCLAALAGCGGNDTQFRLYPLTGPIAEANPAKLIPISMSRDSETSSTITFKLPKPSKTKCTGTWSSVQPRVTSHERGLSLTIKDVGGRYKNTTSDVGGVNSGEIYAVCADGTRVQGSFITGSGTQSGTGTVSDTKGNTYKLLY